MPPKTDKKQGGKVKTNKSKTNMNEKGEKDKKKKKKVLKKGEGMGGTIGLPEKDVKKCILPCVKSFSQPPACCPQEMGCPMPVCCPTAPSCPMPPCPGSTPCCYYQ